MLDRYDIAIIGGGIVGNAIARELSHYEVRTILIEKEAEVSFGTSKANSGIIHSGIHDSQLTLKGRLCVEGNIMWEKLSKELRIPFKRVGEILVARTPEDIPTLRRFLENARSIGIPAELVEGKKLHDMEPNLSKDINCGLLAPTAGVIPPYEMTYAMYENAVQNGVEYLFNCKVTSIVRDGAGFCIRADNHEVRTNYIVNAAGVNADAIAHLIGAGTFRIKPRKGEEYILDKRLDNINNHIIFPTPSEKSKGVLIIKTIEGSTMIGPTADDISDKEDLSTSEAGLEKILEFVRTMMPDIQKNDIIASFAGIRPVSDTNDFIIGETRAVPHFLNAAGIQSPGLTAAPAIARTVVSIIKKSFQAYSIANWMKFFKKKRFKKYDRPHRRFTLASNREKELLLKMNPAYGNVICRCETVTEAEVVAAIKNGARTVDGVKFRTRAGMGRCQAGFCLHHVVRILSRELGIPEEQVTKRGGNSFILKEKR